MGKMRGIIIVDTERCKGCQLCVVACKLQLLSLTHKAVNRKGYPYAQLVDWERCIGCTACATVCPDGCITVYRKKEA